MFCNNKMVYILSWEIFVSKGLQCLMRSGDREFIAYLHPSLATSLPDFLNAAVAQLLNTQ